jgi:glycosyltransferase involved in cell wall biosynthesis
VKPLRVAFLTTDKREHDRDYANPAPGFGTAPAALLPGFARMADLEVHVVACTQHPMTAPAKLADNIYYHSLLVPKSGWLRTAYAGCIRAVRRKLQEIGPDIVHGQGTERDCGITAIFSGYPNVVTIHGNMRMIARVNHAAPFSYQWIAARLERFTLPRSDGVVCITNYTREAVASLARKTWVVPNAVDGSFFEIKSSPSPVLHILCVGSVDGRKNQNALIRAADSLRPNGDFELLFLGGANRETPYVREFFGLLETRSWCRYAGFADRNGLKQYLASASGLILPSLEDNCPMVVLEAMAAGVPVAAARVGGVPDLVRHDETGWLFDPLNSEEMARSLKLLLLDRERRLAVRAKTEAWTRFRPEIIAARHVEIYREVLASRRP